MHRNSKLVMAGAMSALLLTSACATDPVTGQQTITRGGKGALVCVGGEIHSVGLPAVEVVDTVGAGDSFMAGLLSGLLDADLLGDADARERLKAADWATIEPAVSRALACAAITVARAGANPPRRDELPS